MGDSTALHTDHYELTMLQAALQSGVADHQATFEVFARRLPDGRGYGVFCGLDRVVDALERFCFGPAEMDWLRSRDVVDQPTRRWLADRRFGGSVTAYREGELYAAGSPVLTVEGCFGEALLVETIVLSILNHDSAVAAAAERIVGVAGGRPIIEMGSRRTDAEAAVNAARAAYIAGFSTTSNLEAGRRYGVPTAGTAAHAFTLAYDTEAEAFAAQVASMGPGTTLLVDTYDVTEGIRHAVGAAGAGLGAIRIDSGNLGAEAVRARQLLDELGATATRIVVTGDLDDRSIAALADSPVDAYGVGTSVVTGLGAPTAGFVYKMVAMADSSGPGAQQRPVAKRSEGKATHGGRKWAWRLLEAGRATGEEVSTDSVPPDRESRPLQVEVVVAGVVGHRPSLEEIRSYHRQVRDELGSAAALSVRRRQAEDW